MKALLIGTEPPCPLGYGYVREGEHDAVVVGSFTLSQLLMPPETVLEALSQGKPVLVYEPGLPQCKGSRGLAATLASGRRQLKSWGAVFTDGGQKKLITAQEAKMMLAAGKRPAAGAVLTPLAKEILGDTL